MITINSFLHREVLNDIIRRWMYDEACPADADLITRLVHFNHVYVSRYLDGFAGLIFRELHRKELFFRPVRIKGELKDALVSDPPYRNERIDELIRDYHRNPGRFYRETPFHGTLYFPPTATGARSASDRAGSSGSAVWRRNRPGGSSTGSSLRSSGMPTPWRTSGPSGSGFPGNAS